MSKVEPKLFYSKFIWLACSGVCVASLTTQVEAKLCIYHKELYQLEIFLKRRRKKSCHHSVLLVKQGKLSQIFWLAACKLEKITTIKIPNVSHHMLPNNADDLGTWHKSLSFYYSFPPYSFIQLRAKSNPTHTIHCEFLFIQEDSRRES